LLKGREKKYKATSATWTSEGVVTNRHRPSLECTIVVRKRKNPTNSAVTERNAWHNGNPARRDAGWPEGWLRSKDKEEKKGMRKAVVNRDKGELLKVLLLKGCPLAARRGEKDGMLAPGWEGEEKKAGRPLKPRRR